MIPSDLTRFFWDAAHDHKLAVQRCEKCEQLQLPPRPVCGSCASEDLRSLEVSGKASLYTWTVVTQSFDPNFADRVPYVLALVELEEQEGLRMVTNIVGTEPANLKVGMPLEVCFSDATEMSAPLFRPMTLT